MAEWNVNTAKLNIFIPNFGKKHVLKDFEGKVNLLKKGFKLTLEDFFLLSIR